ncbi:MAG TPA: glycosyltransferase family 39 protein, partial [Acidobacteriota bacterium]|nr:glycosyltransferase family 39 protein [Acidobacteriota bacterium]
MYRKYLLLILLLMVSAIYIYTATGLAVFDDGDALYAHVAQQMAKDGEWVTPYANGVRFLDKPPMMYWLMSISYQLFGFNEFAARLPSALAVIGISLLLYFIGCGIAGRPAGFMAGAAFAFCAGTFLFTRMVFPDVLFVFFLTLSMGAFLKWHRDGTNPAAPALVFYAAVAGAVLTKGLMGIVFPAAIILMFMVWSKSFSRLWNFHVVKGSLLFLALALPWHILAAVRNPGFLWYFFINEHFLRFIGRRQPVDYESISVLLFWGLVLVWLFPWSAFFPALRHCFRHSNDAEPDAGGALRLSLSWMAVVLVFFTFSSRIEHYAMPIFPPLALLIGIVLSSEGAVAARARISVRRGFAFLGLTGGVILALLLSAAAVWLAGGFSGQSLSEAATVRLDAYKFYFAPLFEMPPHILDQLLVPLIGTGCVFALGLTGAWWLNRRGTRFAAVVLLNLMMAAFCIFAYRSLGITEEILSSRQFGRELQRLHDPGDTLVVLGDYETANSINFYSPHRLHVYEGSAALLEWGMRYPDAPDLMVDGDRLGRLWA